MKSRFSFLLSLCTLIAFVLIRAEAAHHGDSGESYVALFNGKNLDGWYVAIGKEGRVDNQDIFTVTDGMIHAYKDKEEGSKQPFAGLITEKSYSSYVLSLEYKWGETKHAPRADRVRDAGIIFHMLMPDHIWPNSVECQIQEGDTGDLWVIGTMVTSKVQGTIRNYSPNGNLITRGNTNKRFHRFHRGYSWETPDWNHIEITVKGDYAVFKVNGYVVNEAIDMKQWDEEEQQWIPLTSGPILLQAEGAEIFYRDVKIKELE